MDEAKDTFFEREKDLKKLADESKNESRLIKIELLNQQSDKQELKKKLASLEKEMEKRVKNESDKEAASMELVK